ncbi:MULTISPECIES: hypothetical protein [unclassified Campylobacter]|uniref:hypothetical protein n=1 Tax=unclassified Campylobacter TaxID=2593542 RepID=UPI0016802342|nr:MULTISPECIES: hypothetical protein [unclassified Campylobacter]
MKDLNYYLNLPCKITIEKISKNEGGRYSATMPEFKGVALFWVMEKAKRKHCKN